MNACATLEEFDGKYVRNSDPWSTLSSRDEAIKRHAILCALGRGPYGRMLELGSGAGANSRALAARCVRLDACDGAPAAVQLTKEKLASYRHAKAHHIILPGRLPARRYDAVIIAELLYYLTERQMKQLAIDVARALPGGRLVLAHHKAWFDDAAQSGANIHHRFLRAFKNRGKRVYARQTRRWIVEGYAL